MSATRTIAVYVVREVHWEYNDVTYDLVYNEKTGEPRTLAPLQTFRHRANAEAHRQKLERAARKNRLPVGYEAGGETEHSFDNYCTLPAEEFFRRTTALGITSPPPDADPREMVWSWYSLHQKGELTDDQWHGVWELLDRVRFYTVVPMELELEE